MEVRQEAKGEVAAVLLLLWREAYEERAARQKLNLAHGGVLAVQVRYVRVVHLEHLVLLCVLLEQLFLDAIHIFEV